MIQAGFVKHFLVIIINCFLHVCELSRQIMLEVLYSKTLTGKTSKLIDGKWEQIPASDVHKLTNIEGQIWLAIYQFLFSPEANRKYEMTSHTKEQFMKVSLILCLLIHLNWLRIH